MEDNARIDPTTILHTISKGLLCFVSKWLLGLRIKTYGKGKPWKDFLLMETHGQVGKDYTGWGSGDGL